jgi:HK97 family phage portal protein
MGILSRFRRNKPQEKNWVLTDQGLMNTGWDLGWWQQDLQPRTGGLNETVEACIATLAQTTAMCPVRHVETREDGEAVRMFGSLPERVLLNPNQYTTRTQFFNSIIRSMYFQGNGYAVATRNGNRSIESLHVLDPRCVNPVLDPESGDVYYWTSPDFGRGFNPDTDNVYPARDILHIRINTSAQDPLKGETPLTTAANSIAANSSITSHQASFFRNMSRPSGILSTDEKLSLEQMKQLRQALEEKTHQHNSGGVPILGNGLKFQQMSLTSQDAQMIEAFNMTVEDITRVFRVPLPLVNSMQNSTFNNAEALMGWFLASGLGFLIEHIELELNKLFSLPFSQNLNFETKALLRSDWKTQIETLGEGVLKGIYSPNEARGMIGLSPAKDGDEPRVQQQVVPLSAWDAKPEPAPEPEPVEEDVEAALSVGIAKGFANG